MAPGFRMRRHTLRICCFSRLNSSGAARGMALEIQGGPRKRLAECVHLVRFVVAIAAALGVCAAGTAVWAIGDRAPFVIGLPDWLPISARTPTDGPSTAQLNVTSVPADATVLVDGASARENSALSGSRQWRARIDVDASVRD